MKPETIEGRWGILYRDYPEIYDAFSSFPYEPDAMSVLMTKFPLNGATGLDIGSGTGKSSFGLAKYAREVIGVEPEAAMRAVAERAAVALGVRMLGSWRAMGPPYPSPMKLWTRSSRSPPACSRSRSFCGSFVRGE